MRLLVVIVLLYTVQVANPQRRPEKPSVNQRAAEQEANNKQQQPAGAPHAPSDQGEPPVNATQAETKQAQSYDPRQDALYRWYLGATIAGVVGALVGIGFLISQTIAARNAAQAAKQNADAIINSERAWIMVRAIGEGMPNGHIQIATSVGSDPGDTSAYLKIVCENRGKTPAWITGKRAAITITNSPAPKPIWEELEWVHTAPEPVSVGESTTSEGFWVSTPKRKQASDEMVIVFGMVRYRDIFGQDRETTFGYRISADYRSAERLAGYPEYNNNT